MVGKLKLARCAPENHWWHVTFSVSGRGLSSGLIPDGKRAFEAEFDFLEHKLELRTTDGFQKSVRLFPRSVADFYRELGAVLASLGIELNIWPKPVEFAEVIPFPEDTVHQSYDSEYAHRVWRVLTTVDELLRESHPSFVGKRSPVHFFWGGMDMALTWFSGRRAAPQEGANAVDREAYSHEVISAGFWPGDTLFPEPAFYAYALPQPQGFPTWSVRPDKAFYYGGYREFLLRYDDARKAPSPRRAVLDFLQSTYEAGANLAGWDRGSLERTDPFRGR